MYKLTCFGVAILLLLMGSASMSASNEHLVQPSDMKQALEKNAELRKVNLQKLQGFFKSDMARKALQNSPIDSRRIEKAIPLLTDEELARLAAQSAEAQANFDAGALTNQEITYILIALATAVIVLILVKA